MMNPILTENDFRKHTMKVAESLGYHVSWIEAHESAAGIPDLNLYRNGNDLWVELKVIKDGQIRMRPTQKRWHKARAQSRGASWVLVLNKVKQEVIVVAGGEAAGLDGRVHAWESAALNIKESSLDTLPDILCYLSKRKS